jgi:GT2 family glycosyltransferase
MSWGATSNLIRRPRDARRAPGGPGSRARPRRDRPGRDRPHPDDRAGADRDALAQHRAGGDVRGRLDRDAAGDAGAGAEGDEVADLVVMGEDDLRHDRDVGADGDVGGEHDLGVEDRAGPDPRRVGDHGGRVDEGRVSIVGDPQALDQARPARRIVGRGHAGEEVDVLADFGRHHAGPEHRQAEYVGAQFVRVVVKHADRLPASTLTVDRVDQLDRLASHPARPDQQQLTRRRQAPALVPSKMVHTPWERPAARRSFIGARKNDRDRLVFLPMSGSTVQQASSAAETLPARDRPDLSVIVVTHNGRERALETLDSALAAKGWLEAEWIVVDSGSTDGTPDAISSRFPEVEVIRRPNLGFAASNNVALRQARGRYVLLLNPDVDIHGSLAELVATMDARPEIGLASVIQTDVDGRPQASIRRFPSALRSFGEALFSTGWPFAGGLQEQVVSSRRYDRPGPVDWLVGAFLIARREAVATVGPLDERFFLYSEETDWCYRFWQAGWRVEHLPNLTVTHHCGGGSSGALKPQLTHSKILFAGKHYGRLRASAIRAGIALGHAIRVAAFVPLGVVRRRFRVRARNELSALQVAVGLAPPPFGPYSESAGRRQHP